MTARKRFDVIGKPRRRVDGRATARHASVANM